MSGIDRYRFGRCKLHFDPHVCLCGKVAHPDGDYVLYADHIERIAKLRSENTALNAELARHKAPVSDEEWRNDGRVFRGYRELIDAIITARSLQQVQAQDPEAQQHEDRSENAPHEAG